MKIKHILTNLELTFARVEAEQANFEKCAAQYKAWYDLSKDTHGDYVMEETRNAFWFWIASAVAQSKVGYACPSPAEAGKAIKAYTEAFGGPLEVVNQADNVKNPKHYQILDGVESIDVIACSLTEDQFKGFCLGNILKYRIRAGNKDALEQDIAKANEYKSIFENKKHLCRKG